MGAALETLHVNGVLKLNSSRVRKLGPSPWESSSDRQSGLTLSGWETALGLNTPRGCQGSSHQHPLEIKGKGQRGGEVAREEQHVCCGFLKSGHLTQEDVWDAVSYCI